VSEGLRLLVTGISTRAAAESAARAGFHVTALDAFADLDQHPAVRALSLPRDFGVSPTARAAARAAREITCDAVVYLSPFENAPHAVTQLGEGRKLWGNASDVLRRVRDPFLLMEVLEQRGLATPATRSAGERQKNDSSIEWLRKRVASGGGRQVAPWRRGVPVSRGSYLQERIDGTPGSIVFAAAGGRAIPLGVSRQLIGDPAFGASGYRYCGSILGAGGSESFGGALIHRATHLAETVASDFGLIGLNGIDFIARDDVPVPIEVNPRWSSSMELVERVSGQSMFGLHAAACTSGSLAAVQFRPGAPRLRAVGKAVVFARRNLVAPDTRRWLDDETLRDVPRPGEPVAAGHPLCTVFASGDDDSGCYAALVDRAARLYDELDRRVG
jgi:predicted ATP-grasp superfamily ATP-dependent carboligase